MRKNGAAEKKRKRKRGEKKKWGNLLDRANMHDKARRRELEGVRERRTECLSAWRCVGDTKLRCELGEHDRTGEADGWMDGWMDGDI